jgi:hypothetical protein
LIGRGFLFFGVAASAALGGCDGSVGHATLRPACMSSGADAVALVVSGAAGAYPQLRMRFPGTIRTLAGRHVEVQGAGGADGSAQWCSREGACADPQLASAEFQSARFGHILVRVQATLPRGGEVFYQLLPRWHGETLACG